MNDSRGAGVSWGGKKKETDGESVRERRECGGDDDDNIIEDTHARKNDHTAYGNNNNTHTHTETRAVEETKPVWLSAT